MGGNILLSAFADEYDSALACQLAFLREQGISKTELRFADGDNVSLVSAEKAREIRKKLDDAGITPSALGSPIGKVGWNTDMRVYLETVKRIYENACILGAEKVRVFSFYLNGTEAEEAEKQIFTNIGALLNAADRFGLTLCHENEAGIYGDSPERCEKLLKAFGGRLRAVFDMGNFVLGGFRPYPAYVRLLPYIDYFHIKDALFPDKIVPPGLGDAEIKEILTDFAQHTEGAFTITLEPHLSEFPGLSTLTGAGFELAAFAVGKAAFRDALARCRKIMGEINE